MVGLQPCRLERGRMDSIAAEALAQRNWGGAARLRTGIELASRRLAARYAYHDAALTSVSAMDSAIGAA
jgi:hypothetical protein